jgi:hypothetical protein
MSIQLAICENRLYSDVPTSFTQADPYVFV